jgi:hypothetical protein
MIPIKDKKYMINFKGYWGSYSGEGLCTGEKEDFCGKDGDTFTYGFKIPSDEETCFFLETDIVAMIDAEQIQNQIDSESDYCAKCDSCGETGCCPPVKCEAVICKYGDINLKEYNCFQDQWEVMYNALKIIVEECGGGKIGDYAKETLNEVDKLWDKLYSKE